MLGFTIQPTFFSIPSFLRCSEVSRVTNVCSGPTVLQYSAGPEDRTNVAGQNRQKLKITMTPEIASSCQGGTNSKLWRPSQMVSNPTHT
jgi:hypothetical protein